MSSFKHPKYRLRKNCVDMCARDGRGAIETCLSEKGALGKKCLGNTDVAERIQWILRNEIVAFLILPRRLLTNNNDADL